MLYVTKTFMILPDRTSDSYSHARRELTDAQSKTSAWNAITVDDLYIDNCFNNVNNLLHMVPGVKHQETKELYGPKSDVSMSMSYEKFDIHLFIGAAKDEASPALFIECTYRSGLKNSLPRYLEEIIDNYKAKKMDSSIMLHKPQDSSF